MDQEHQEHLANERICFTFYTVSQSVHWGYIFYYIILLCYVAPAIHNL